MWNSATAPDNRMLRGSAVERALPEKIGISCRRPGEGWSGTWVTRVMRIAHFVPSKLLWNILKLCPCVSICVLCCATLDVLTMRGKSLLHPQIWFCWSVAKAAKGSPFVFLCWWNWIAIRHERQIWWFLRFVDFPTSSCQLLASLQDLSPTRSYADPLWCPQCMLGQDFLTSFNINSIGFKWWLYIFDIQQQLSNTEAFLHWRLLLLQRCKASRGFRSWSKQSKRHRRGTGAVSAIRVKDSK